MPRADLLALSPDDLAAITNRGIVKRAQKELEAGSPTFTLDEPTDAPLVVAWSDGVSCRFPVGKTIHDAICSSGALGVTRHIVRSVLAYQQHHAAPGETPPSTSPATLPETQSDEPRAETTDAPAAATAEAASSARDSATLTTAPAPDVTPSPVRIKTWDPGAFSDADLVARFRSLAINKAEQRFKAGVLVELTRGEKPTARFLDEPCLVRFLVPGDLRYITADCAEPLLATFVPLAVWAFRALPPDRAAGLVSIQPSALPTPTARLDELDALLLELARDGLANVSSSWPQRLERLEDGLRDAGLIWPAEGAAELRQQHQMYHAHDARFDPSDTAMIVGELLARGRAIRRQTQAAPQLLIRGTRSDKTTDIAGGRLIGLGCGARASHRTATLSVYLQEADTGGVMVVERTFAEPTPDANALNTAPAAPRSFSDLANTIITRGVSLAALGASQLLLKSGKRSPSGQLSLPRTAGSMTANPQGFAWEQLKPPAAVESFAQLQARLQSLPPSYLRPRRLTENLHVVAIEKIEPPEFDPATQRLVATMHDRAGGTGLLLHSYHARGAAGFDALATTLTQRGEQARFVCGHVRATTGGLQIHPVSLVFDDGLRRTCLQPWIARAPLTGEGPTDSPSESESAVEHDASPSDDDAAASGGSLFEHYLEQRRDAAAELLLSGVKRLEPQTLRAWREHIERGRRLGFVKLVDAPAQLVALLEARADAVRWEPTPAAKAALHLCLLSRVAADVAS